MKRFLVLLACLFALTSCKSESVDDTGVSKPPPQKTTASAALPDEAFKVTLSLAKVPTTIERSGQLALQVKAKNAGNAVWPALGQEDGKFWVKLGNRWLDEKTGKVVMDDGRALLPFDIGPGEVAEMSLIVTAPKKAGDYILEIGMLQERVAWFQEKGAGALKMKVTVK